MNQPLKISGFISIISFILLTSCGSTVQDSEGNKYKTIRIGNQEWMAENLNVSHFRNGDTIHEVRNDKEWELAGREGKPAWCYFNNNTDNGKKYGKLYNWYAVSDPRGLTPVGWHIPGGDEWTQLIEKLGGEQIVADKLKSTSGWEADCNGNNESGFSGLPGGYRHYTGGFNRYDNAGGGYWWASSEGFTYIACSFPLYHSNGGENRSFTSKARGFSVRCLRD
jgi:uncharacterized protein (TIGR02145 family)